MNLVGDEDDEDDDADEDDADEDDADEDGGDAALQSEHCGPSLGPHCPLLLGIAATPSRRPQKYMWLIPERGDRVIIKPALLNRDVKVISLQSGH